MTVESAPSSTTAPAPTVVVALRENWRVYAIEGALLGTFMISACGFTVLLEHPDSLVRHAIDSSALRRFLIGVAMGATAVGLIYNPLGRRSGAHMNPAMTLSFLRLGRIKPVDAAFYIASQFVGSALGVWLTAVIIGGGRVAHPSVSYAVTVPGAAGVFIAWVAEFVIAMILIGVVLAANQRPRLIPFTGCFAAILVMLYITFEAPLSGMSLNPARTFGSAVHAHLWTAWWIYFTAPVLGMLAGIELHRLLGRVPQHKLCGKLTHSHRALCFIHCNCLQHNESAYDPR